MNKIAIIGTIGAGQVMRQLESLGKEVIIIEDIKELQTKKLDISPKATFELKNYHIPIVENSTTIIPNRSQRRKNKRKKK